MAGRKSRVDGAAQAAADAASEAARVLQARSQEARTQERQDAVTATPEAPKTSELGVEEASNLLKKRPHVQMHEYLDEQRAKREAQPQEETKAEEKKEENVEEPKAEAEAPKTEAPVEEVKEAKTEIKTIRVKVDGEEFDVPQSDIDEAGGLTAYRTNRAAENRYKRFSSEMNEMMGRLRQMTPQQPQKPQQSDEQFVAEQMDIIRFGTKEEGAKAFLAIQARSQRPQMDQNALANFVSEKLRSEQAAEGFKKEFSDIASNPILFQAAQTLDRQRREELAKTYQGGPFDWSNHFRKIGNEVRSAFGRSSQTATTPQTAGTPSQQSVKEERKASVTALPSTSARAAVPEEKQLSPEEQRKVALSEMRKSRGQFTG